MSFPRDVAKAGTISSMRTTITRLAFAGASFSIGIFFAHTIDKTEINASRIAVARGKLAMLDLINADEELKKGDEELKKGAARLKLSCDELQVADERLRKSVYREGVR